MSEQELLDRIIRLEKLMQETRNLDGLLNTPGLLQLLQSVYIKGHLNLGGTLNVGTMAKTGTELITNLNADQLDGQHGAYYLPASSYTAADILAKLLTVDGAGSSLDADQLDGNHAPANTSYSVSWTSSGVAPSLGNGSLVGRYSKIGSLVVASVTLTWGSTTSGGTGTWRFSAPFAAGVMSSGMAYAIDQGTAYRLGASLINYAENTLAGFSDNSGNIWQATFPFTWAANDIMNLTIAYQTA